MLEYLSWVGVFAGHCVFILLIIGAYSDFSYWRTRGYAVTIAFFKVAYFTYIDWYHFEWLMWDKIVSWLQ